VKEGKWSLGMFQKTYTFVVIEVCLQGGLDGLNVAKNQVPLLDIVVDVTDV